MSDDLLRRFASVRTDVLRRQFTEPGAVRAEGARRARVRRGVLVAAGATVLAVSVGTVAAIANGITRPGPGTGGSTASPSGTGRIASADPGPAPPGSPSPSTGEPSRPPGGDCRPADLDPRPVYDGQGAAGTAYQYVIVKNRSTTRCRLATYPELLATDAAGALLRIPVNPETNHQEPVLLAPGQWATFVLRTAPGHDPLNPACRKDASYRGIWLVLAGGRRFPLPSYRLDVPCDSVGLSAWRHSTWPAQPEGAGPTVAPAPTVP